MYFQQGRNKESPEKSKSVWRSIRDILIETLLALTSLSPSKLRCTSTGAKIIYVWQISFLYKKLRILGLQEAREILLISWGGHSCKSALTIKGTIHLLPTPNSIRSSVFKVYKSFLVLLMLGSRSFYTFSCFRTRSIKNFQQFSLLSTRPWLLTSLLKLLMMFSTSSSE